MFDYILSADQTAMIQGLRELLKGEFDKAYFRGLEDRGEWPWEPMKLLGQHGYLGILAPENLGGAGGTSFDAFLCLEEATRIMGGSAMAYFTTMCFGVRSLALLGTPDQQEAIMPGLLSGTGYVGLCLTEPDGGTDVVGAMRSRATLCADGSWLLNGSKVFTTGAHVADHVIAVVRTAGSDAKAADAITMFLVPTTSEGLTVTPIPIYAQRTTGANFVTFDEVRVGPEAVFGDVGRGLSGLFTILNDERIGAATMALGLAQAALDEALEYVRTRQAFGRPIGQFQGVQHKLADLWTQTEAVRQLIRRAAALQSAGMPAEMESAGAKLLASQNAISTAQSCMELLGGYSHTLEFSMNYYLRDAGVFAFAPVTNNAARNLIGQRLGLPKSY